MKYNVIFLVTILTTEEYQYKRSNIIVKITDFIVVAAYLLAPGREGDQGLQHEGRD